MHDEFLAILKRAGQSVTKPRIAVFETLSHAEEPLKNGVIAARTPHVNRASIYRALELFTELGVTTTTVRGWTPFTELAEPFKPHHHHIVCSNCHKIEAIASETLEDILGIIAARHDFELTSHLVELTGTCSSCRQVAP